MNNPRDSHAMIAHGIKVYVVGGQEQTRAGVEVFISIYLTWTTFINRFITRNLTRGLNLNQLHESSTCLLVEWQQIRSLWLAAGRTIQVRDAIDKLILSILFRIS
jgi:hypothetical protein